MRPHLFKTILVTQRTIRSTPALLDNGLIDAAQQTQIDEVARKFSVSITPHVLDVIAGAQSDAVARQFVPSVQELQESVQESSDPIGDQAHSPVPGIIHRYEDRVLLNLVQSCAVYCRYCFRRENVGSHNTGLTPPQIRNALDYIRSDDRIWEVILSGGDPLVMSARRLSDILQELGSVSHIGIVRIHTRVPAVAPEKISQELISALKQHPALFLVLHVNHADELTPEVCASLARLADAGIPLLSQSVLLKDINDDVRVLTRLFRKLLVNRVKPYYLHHGDLARGTGHFRTSIEKGQQLMKALRGPVSGLCQPNYVLDLPGGAGKVPIGPQYLSRTEPGHYCVQDVSGGQQHYKEDRVESVEE